MAGAAVSEPRRTKFRTRLAAALERTRLLPRRGGAEPAKTDDATANRELLEVICLSLGLGLTLVATKFVLLPFPVTTWGEFVRWVLRLAVVTAEDGLFLAALAALAFAVGGLTRRSGRAHFVWRLVRGALYAACGLYAVAAVLMFRVMMVPLTVELLSFAGGPGLMASSLATFVTPPFVAAVVAASVAPLLAVSFAARQVRRGRLNALAGALRPLAAGSVVLAIAGGFVCRSYVAGSWTDPNRWERRIAANPHLALLASGISTVVSGDALALDFDPADVDLSDFDGSRSTDGASGKDSAVAASDGRPPNLIVVVMESVGVEQLALYGAPYETMPQLARRAEQGGVVFENFYAHAPSSPKGLVALTASVLPRVDWKLITRDAPDFRVPTLAEQLRTAGYRSAYLHAGVWSWKQRDRYLESRGVDYLFDADDVTGPQPFSWGASDRAMFDAAIEFIDRDPASPFHLLLWTIETHHPYVDHRDAFPFDVDDEERARQLSAIRATDILLGDLFDALEARGLEDSTWVLVTGDHGESFGQHGQRMHSFGVYEPTVHVPCVLVGPGLAPGLRRDGSLRQQVDIPATFAGLAGVPRPDVWQGRSLLSAEGHERVYFFAVGNDVQLGVREESLKYHYHVRSRYEELFDLANDPDELENLAERLPDDCARFRRRVGGLVRWQRELMARHGSR